ncbi:MAG TPA: methylaspartate mutase [Firmicutes bacterium]|nr:methylaspartate mutase [Candidatus Fermentithermobacillaceae bacterium]
MEEKKVESILATDVGSTTTKAILIEKRGDEYRLVTRGEMPTTVEAPWENVMIGVRKAIKRVEELIDRPILDDTGHLIRPKEDGRGVDIYVSTSSAGGGLQMMVAGLVKSISASSAHRAALGAGAVVLDVIAVDDGRSQSEQITRITELRPDIILMSGGVDGGSVSYIASIAEIIKQANPQPRFGATYKLPLIYAGNKDAQDIVTAVCGEEMDVHIVDNLRPRHDVENLGPAREAIHDLFMNHVMAQAPGYGELMGWVDTTIMPTPGAVGRIIELMADKYKANIVGVDIGGATTDVFSSFEGTFTRTVSANLGMSYSICNVLEEAGFDNILRWIPFGMDQSQISDWIANKMVRPTTIPQTLYHLVLEQALAREALRLSFEHHKSLAKKVEKEEVGVVFKSQASMVKASGRDIIEMMKLDILVGSGGVLSHAPRRQQAALMLLDAFQPEGVTQLAVDSIFMMPHLGVLSTVYPEIAAEVFDKDCLVRLGTAIAPVGPAKRGTPMATVKISLPNGETLQEKVISGEIKVIPLGVGETATCKIQPANGNIDVGTGRGKALEVKVHGGLVGIMLDGRGRPIAIPEDPQERVKTLTSWINAMNAYPSEKIAELQERYPVKAEGAQGGKKRGGLFSFFK